MVFYFTKGRTNTEKIAHGIILTNLINRGEDMQVMYKKNCKIKIKVGVEPTI